MTTPTPPSRPDQSVSRENSANMSEMFQGMTDSIEALNQTMRRTAEELSAALDMQGRFSYGPDTQLAYQARQRVGTHIPEVTTKTLQNMRQQFGITNDLTLGMTRLDARQASTSLNHARAWAAQRLGETIAGGPLYSERPPNAAPGGGPSPGQTTSSGSGPVRPSGGTPAGTPTAGGGGGGGGAGGGSAPPPYTSGNWGFGYGGQNARPGSPMMRALGARIATSGGSTDRLLNAARHLPVVGLGMDVAEKGGHFYQRQREAGRNYQEIEGGSNLDAQRERGHEEAYRLGMGFGMSEDAARQSFQTVTSLGFNRRGDSGSVQNRQGALDFIYHNYNARGMDVGESAQILQTATQNATVSLTGLSSALKDVSDTAGKAGVNAKTMRAQFDSVLGQALGSGAGAGSVSLAQSLTSTQASYGRMFQGQNFGGELSANQGYLIGGRYGLSPGQTQTMMRTQPKEYARMLTGNNSTVIDSLPGMTPEAKADLQAIIQSYGGAGTIDEQKAASIGAEWLNKWQANMGIDLNVWSQVINQMTGMQLDPNSVMSWIVQQVSGNTEAAHAANQSNANAPVKTGKNGAIPSTAPTGKSGLYTENKPLPGSSHKYDLDAFTHMNAGRQWWGGKGTNKAGQSYEDAARKSGTRDPVLEALLQNVKDPNNTHVQVSTKSGQRVVSFADAMKDFPDELASGNAMFVDGPQAGRRPQEITGGTIDATRDTKGEMTSAKGGKVGQSLEDWQKKHPGKGGASGGAVTVGLTAEAKKLLQLLPSNNNPAAGAATVPTNPYPTYGSRGN